MVFSLKIKYKLKLSIYLFKSISWPSFCILEAQAKPEFCKMFPTEHCCKQLWHWESYESDDSKVIDIIFPFDCFLFLLQFVLTELTFFLFASVFDFAEQVFFFIFNCIFLTSYHTICYSVLNNYSLNSFLMDKQRDIC